MGSRKTYRGVQIKSLDRPRLLASITGAVVVSIDVAKAAFAAAFVLLTGTLLRIVRFEHPTETSAFLELLDAIKQRAIAVTVLMEPTGTYGDALRYQLGLRGHAIRMVQPKRTHDAREVFDGVPSKHDNKDTVTLAQLHLAGASTEWRASDPPRRALRAILDRHLAHDRAAEVLFGQIEARLSRHWPELGLWLSVRDHVSARALLEQFGTPQRIAESPDDARTFLRRVSRGSLSPHLIDGVIHAAESTFGVPALAEEAALLKDMLVQLRGHLEACDACEQQVGELLRDDKMHQGIQSVVGKMAAAAVLAYLGSPKDFSCARAWLKAAGLSLREVSSGTHKGEMHITKRGPSIVRKLLYMAALRACQSDPLARAWYLARNASRQDRKPAAVVALMRKLLAAAYHVGKYGVAYDSSKLFDKRRLTLSEDSPTPRRSKPSQRTQPRSIAHRASRTRANEQGGVSA
jgi:transposase